MRDARAGGCCGVVGSGSSTATTMSAGAISEDGGNGMCAAVRVGDPPGLGGRGIDDGSWDTVESIAAVPGLGVCAGGDGPHDCSLYAVSARYPPSKKAVSYYFNRS